MILAGVVSVAGFVVRTWRAPCSLSVPANTSAPAVLSTGMDSPVIGAWFTLELPEVTSPSTGIFSPGRTNDYGHLETLVTKCIRHFYGDSADEAATD